MAHAPRLQTHWRKTIAEMKRLSTKAEETWIDCSKNCNTKATDLMHQLKADLFVAAGFVDAMDGTDAGNARAMQAVAGLDTAAREAAACWKCRKGASTQRRNLMQTMPSLRSTASDCLSVTQSAPSLRSTANSYPPLVRK